MPHLRLSEADRERLGAPELLPFDLRGITNREAIEIAKLGYKTPSLFRAALMADENGLDALAWTAAVWMGLRRVGVESDLSVLEFDMDRLQFVPDDQPDDATEDESGKAPGRSTRSAKARSTSGATSRARSRSQSSRS